MKGLVTLASDMVGVCERGSDEDLSSHQRMTDHGHGPACVRLFPFWVLYGRLFNDSAYDNGWGRVLAL